jgi:hypothetical protein
MSDGYIIAISRFLPETVVLFGFFFIVMTYYESTVKVFIKVFTGYFVQEQASRARTVSLDADGVENALACDRLSFIKPLVKICLKCVV